MRTEPKRRLAALIAEKLEPHFRQMDGLPELWTLSTPEARADIVDILLGKPVSRQWKAHHLLLEQRERTAIR